VGPLYDALLVERVPARESHEKIIVVDFCDADGALGVWGTPFDHPPIQN
jgi:hypothetical protein